MRIDNATFRAVDIRWNSIQLPLKAGTPISVGGVVANDGNAIGIICQTIRVAAPLTQIPVLVGGDVLLDEAEQSFGETLTEEAIAAMKGIRFYDLFGRVVGEAAGGAGLPEVTAADNGKMLGVVGGEWKPFESANEPVYPLFYSGSLDSGNLLDTKQTAMDNRVYNAAYKNKHVAHVTITSTQWDDAKSAGEEVKLGDGLIYCSAFYAKDGFYNELLIEIVDADNVSSVLQYVLLGNCITHKINSVLHMYFSGLVASPALDSIAYPADDIEYVCVSQALNAVTSSTYLQRYSVAKAP